MVRRSAFTLIELIFAIVIIAISVVSLPIMNQAIGKGIDANLVQEAIFAAATELNEAVTANWDDNSTEAGSTNLYARVIDINGSSCNGTTHLRIGHISGVEKHRRCLNSSLIGPEDANTTALISLDDMEHVKRNIFVDTTTDAKGYKKKYTSQVDVTRGATFNGSANPDMKLLTITIRDEEDKILTLLKTYSANIGEIDYYHRSY